MIFYRQNKSDNTETVCLLRQQSCTICTDERVSDSVTNYNYVGDTKKSVSIKKTNANKCTLSEIFLTEILK